MLNIITGEKNKILRNKSEEVEKITPAVLALITEMKETLAQAKNGVGLAAPQVGRNIRLFIVSEELAKDGHTIFINPAITQTSKKDAVEEEGCLSLPEKWHELARADKATVKAIDAHGKKFKIRAKGILARLMLHEVDHLNGVLFVDHLK
ncbi:MAG: peptide deformylase [Parcubacteria group bacterium]|nr:peptide deformylase [Parcubacteria group bacterium]